MRLLSSAVSLAVIPAPLYGNCCTTSVKVPSWPRKDCVKVDGHYIRRSGACQDAPHFARAIIYAALFVAGSTDGRVCQVYNSEDVLVSIPLCGRHKTLEHSARPTCQKVHSTSRFGWPRRLCCTIGLRDIPMGVCTACKQLDSSFTFLALGRQIP